MITWLAVMLCLAVSPICEMPQEDLNGYLKDLMEGQPCFGGRVEAVARAALGTPYADGPLGEGPNGTHDTDPLMDLTKVDCVTYIEQTIALAASVSYQEAFALLQRIRYRNGTITYEARNHFMISDWLANNRWCRDVSSDLGVATTALTRTISRKDFFKLVKAPECGQDTPNQDVTICYVPTEAAVQAEKKLPSPALIVFIGRKPEWLFALHTGFYIRDADGKGLLHHASSKAGKVSTAKLPEYLYQNAERYLGFTAYAIRSPFTSGASS